jgi:hypothetical protein
VITGMRIESACTEEDHHYACSHCDDQWLKHVGLRADNFFRMVEIFGIPAISTKQPLLSGSPEPESIPVRIEPHRVKTRTESNNHGFSPTGFLGNAA